MWLRQNYGSLKRGQLFFIRNIIFYKKQCLKVVFTTFLQACLLASFSLNKSSYQTRKSVFYFTSKALSVIEKIKFLEFYISKFHDIIKCLGINKKYISLNNLGSKHSLLMNFGQFMSYYKRKNFKKFYKNCGLKTSSRVFCVCKELSTTSVRKWSFWSKQLILDM